uniref:Uncharacterized protein n=1 Tax=Salvator merianae TaxID=96440 RepID=A0A8D0KM22_SALMN
MQIQKKITQKPSAQGGWGMPNLVFYFQATVIASALHSNRISQPRWRKYEIFQDKLSAMIPYTTGVQRSDINQQNPIIKEQMKVWYNWQHKLLPSTSLLTPIKNHQKVSSVLPKECIRRLEENGFITIGDFFTPNKDIRMNEIKEAIFQNRPRWFIWLVIERMLKFPEITRSMTRSTCKFEKILKQATLSLKGIISNIYLHLISKQIVILLS